MWRRSLTAIAALGSLAGSALRAQQRVLIQGFVEAEAWRTRGGSILLARNADLPGLAGSVVLWGAADLHHHLLLVALGEGYGGAASAEGKTEVELEQVTLKWQPSQSFAVEGGRFPAPIGSFASRRLAPSNPVIGAPDGYEVSYPWGLQISGNRGAFDYRAALVDRPISNPRYVPEGGSRFRPAVSAGLTMAPGVRLGASFTTGSYLGPSVDGALGPGERWQDFGQRVFVLDGTVTRGYFELRAETAFSSYDVPMGGGSVGGVASFADLKYTWTPRFFTAARIERNDYAFIQPQAPGSSWIANRTTFYDAEIGVGFRLDASTLIKASYRRDDWRVGPPLDQFLKNGSAIAIQISRGFDVTSWLGGPR